ncbi:hypothetical protein BJ138DRAFT_1138016 [Hygrophoropsis aurantiaca]|uniref:Uncharacterized protein n=1 Tax=Hygrophoropsis aurantiaca TaxID=72124 RepID=A0ACB7ZYY6_9AGAM|nr:hypothetical protein BJ138DRAFT_1138016 [Hygrophoropsis aurantiaca]
MTDLTVLLSPTPFYPQTPRSFQISGLNFNFNLARYSRSRSQNDLSTSGGIYTSRPVMITLEAPEPETPEQSSSPYPSSAPASQSTFPELGEVEEVEADENIGRAFGYTREPERTGGQEPEPEASTEIDETLLSPPRNTFKARRPVNPRIITPTATSTASVRLKNQTQTSHRAAVPIPLVLPKRPASAPPTQTTFPSRPTTLRPTTFWRKTSRSGVTALSYSPASHLIRRSTFIAAGLAHDKPYADLSALGVESRVALLVLGPDHSGHLSA